MRILVTAGNTLAMVDRVRAITNIFTGRTGTSIALEAYRRGHSVILLTSHPDVIQELQGDLSLDPGRWKHWRFNTFEQLQYLMFKVVFDGAPQVIVHAAAVSDYLAAGVYAPAATTHFDNDMTWRDERDQPMLLDRNAGKVKSDEPELWIRLKRAPKLIDQLRGDLGFKGTLVKFKLEVGVDEATLLDIAEKSRQASQADWMVANTLEGAGDWALVGNERGYRKVSRAELPATLLDLLPLAA